MRVISRDNNPFFGNAKKTCVGWVLERVRISLLCICLRQRRRRRGPPPDPRQFAGRFTGGDPQTPQGNEEEESLRQGGERSRGQERKRQKRERTGKGPPVRWGPSPILDVYAVPHLRARLVWCGTQPVGNCQRHSWGWLAVVHRRGGRRGQVFFRFLGGSGVSPVTLSRLRFIGVIMWLFRR